MKHLINCRSISDQTIHVIIVEDQPTVFGKVTLLSIYKRDGTEIRENWDYLQNIKNEVFGKNAQAVEVYPKTSKVVNRMNMRHLWILPEGFEMPFGLGYDFMRMAQIKAGEEWDKIMAEHRKSLTKTVKLL